MRGCYDDPSYGPIMVEFEVAIAELEHIAIFRRYMRQAVWDLVDELWVIKHTVIYQLRWTDGVKLEMELDLLRRVIRSIGLLCSKLNTLWMRRRRMREPLIQVAYRLDHVRNQLKWRLATLVPVEE